MNNGSFGEYLASLRKSKGLTQKQLGKIIKCGDKTISKWETGSYFPDIMYLSSLSEALDIPISELLECSEKSNNKSKNINLIKNVKKYQKKFMIKTILIVLVIIAVITSVFLSVFFYVKKNEWHVTMYESNDLYYVVDGSVVYNQNEAIYNIKGLKYNSDFIGTDKEPIVKRVKISVYDEDSLVYENSYDYEKPTLIHKVLQNLNCYEDTDFKHNKNGLLRINIDYINNKDEKESYIVMMDKK